MLTYHLADLRTTYLLSSSTLAATHTSVGTLNYEEVTQLARRFFDGRQPTEARIRSIFREFEKNGDGENSLESMISGVQSMHRAFEKSAEQLDHV